MSAIEHAPRLDPYVGAVSGIGPALFAYARMRSGANAIKPDIRVVASEVARELDIDRLVLDQLLWWLDA